LFVPNIKISKKTFITDRNFWPKCFDLWHVFCSVAKFSIIQNLAHFREIYNFTSISKLSKLVRFIGLGRERKGLIFTVFSSLPYLFVPITWLTFSIQKILENIKIHFSQSESRIPKNKLKRQPWLKELGHESRNQKPWTSIFAEIIFLPKCIVPEMGLVAKFSIPDLQFP